MTTWPSWRRPNPSSTGSLRGQVVWITGASSGIGEYLAYELAKCGVKLALSGTNVENLEKVKQKCIGTTQLPLSKINHSSREECLLQKHFIVMETIFIDQIHTIECGPLGDSDVLLKPFDITDFDSFSSHVEAVINHFGKVDILVNNAGRSQRAGFETIDLPVDEAMFKTNVFGAIHLTRLMVPHFKKQGRGHVVVTSSLAGKMGQYRRMSRQLGGKMKAGERRMSTDRCSHLCAVAIANKLDEVWIAQNPVLILFYLSQYLPTIYRK
ncbi:DHRS7 [Cordylochernes scorpioides]|uniref:DHRS7 n=1 Tax=Cordylochernes scorpioides TaxID=51811 RepID=A0ABY6KTM7_9ARAC|nr:DHRS7 [Cordylochernes scorpioides]